MYFFKTYPKLPEDFDGARALEDIEYQLSLGPRTVGSESHARVISWMQAELKKAGWKSEVQEQSIGGHIVKNIVAKQGGEENPDLPWIILGAHYDSRLIADKDKDFEKSQHPVPGANDGASGVAVLLELARVLPDNLSKNMWLVFFDAEDNGDIPGWDWILGSRAFAKSLTDKPDGVVILDMVGDSDLNLYLERSSNLELSGEIWSEAAKLGYSQFIPVEKYRILDDHTPFLQSGIPAVDIIDFDYPYHHTSEDTLDKVSAPSLEAVGETLYAWIMEGE
jgi:Zn-dependent M28 family amino/carboxypeptidase